MKLSDEEVFDRIYAYHQLVCERLGNSPTVKGEDRLAILGITEKDENLCYNVGLRQLAQKLPNNHRTSWMTS